MDELDELDIELQHPDDIGSRLVLLSALVLWPSLTDQDERSQWFSWLRLQSALSVAMDWEVDLLRSHTTHPEANEISAEAAEAMIPLAWAVGLIAELPMRSQPEVLEEVLQSLPVPSERVEPFLDGLILLDENAIALERERAEIWNWRVNAEVSRRISHGSTRVEVTEAIHEVVLEAASTMVIPENDGTDLLVDGAPVRELDTELLDWLLMATDERLRALNWVCGLTEWDQIDIAD